MGSTLLISKSPEPKHPCNTFKKVHSSSELINLNRNHNLASKPAIKRERLSLKSHHSKAQENDVVILAGKGHETYQVLMNQAKSIMRATGLTE